MLSCIIFRKESDSGHLGADFTTFHSENCQVKVRMPKIGPADRKFGTITGQKNPSRALVEHSPLSLDCCEATAQRTDHLQPLCYLEQSKVASHGSGEWLAPPVIRRPDYLRSR